MVTQRKGQEPWLAREGSHPDLLYLPRCLLGRVLPLPWDQDSLSAAVQAAPSLPGHREHSNTNTQPSFCHYPCSLPTFQSLPASR